MNQLTYIDTEMLEKMSWLDYKKISSANSLTIIRSNSDFNLLSILKLLYPLTRHRLYFSRLYYNSGIRMKKSFLNYLNLCIQMGFIKKIPRNELKVYYLLTEKGQTLLDMFYIA